MTVFRVPEVLQSQGEKLSNGILARFGVQLHFSSLSTGWYGVFSPHIYNSELEIEEAVHRLKQL